MTPSSGDPLQVAVCVCTYRRPAVLFQVLERLVDVATDARGVASITVVVVDDDPGRSAESTVAAFACALDVRYVVSGSGNISVARNRGLDEATAIADFVAITDDDCLPKPDWIRQLLVVQQWSAADIVTGHIIDLAPEGAPRWFVEEPWVAEQAPLPDGSLIEVGALKNTLLRAATVHKLGLRFDEGFGRTGGEDVLFFYTAAQLGLQHRFAASAVVTEEVPLSRARLGYQLRRAFWYGNAEARTCLAAGRYRRGRLIGSSLKRIGIGPARLVKRVRAGQTSEWRYALALALTGLGRLLGALGITVHHSSMNARAARRQSFEPQPALQPNGARGMGRPRRSGASGR